MAVKYWLFNLFCCVVINFDDGENISIPVALSRQFSLSRQSRSTNV